MWWKKGYYRTQQVLLNNAIDEVWNVEDDVSLDITMVNSRSYFIDIYGLWVCTWVMGYNYSKIISNEPFIITKSCA